MKVVVIASACLLAALTVTALKEEHEIEKRADTLNTISGSLLKSAGIAANVGALIGATTSAIPLIGVFTGLFAFITGLIQDDRAYWEKIEKKMREIAKDEVASYHDLLAKNFISNIKRSVKLYDRFPEKTNGQPNKQKINEGVVLSGDINNGQQWVNIEIGRNPQKMISYFMEVAALDAAVLYSNAALYGADKNHWIRLEERLGNHISDAEDGARKVLKWRMADDKFKCERKQCAHTYRKCGPKGASRCANNVDCTTAYDLMDTRTGRQSYRSRCGAQACTRYREITYNYNKTKKFTNNCNWFTSEIKAQTMAWLKTNVWDHVNEWRNLKNRASVKLGR